MKINKKNVKERLAGVPEEKRSHIYDATIVIEFLAATFMPTRYFVPDNFKATPGQPLGPKSMRALCKDQNLRLTELYDLYLLYREEKDYTMKIESRYIFSIIIRNLRYYKNHWEFLVYRVGAAQVWHVGPLLLRSDVPAEKRNRFAEKIHDQTVDEITVEADPVAQPEEDRFIEVHADRFREVTYEVDVRIKPKMIRSDGTA